MNDFTTLGEMNGHPLRVMRCKHNLTLEGLAEAIKVSVTTVWRAENGYTISAESRRRLCTYFARTSEELGLIELTSREHKKRQVSSTQPIMQTTQAVTAIANRQQAQNTLSVMSNQMQLLSTSNLQSEQSSYEQVMQLHQSLSEGISSGWKSFVSTSNTQILILAQSQLTLIQQYHAFLYPSVRPYLYTGVYGLIGAALHFQERDREALHAHYNGYLAAMAIGKSWYIAQSLICQADCYHALGQYDLGICAIKEALECIGTPQDETQVCTKAHLLTCWADHAMMLKDYGTAQKMLDLSRQHIDQILPNEEFDRAAWLLIAGKYALMTAKYEVAVQYLEKALREIPEPWILRRVMTAIGLAKAYARMKEQDKSLTIAKNIIPMIHMLDTRMINHWFLEYMREDLLGIFPRDNSVRLFVTDVSQSFCR